MADERNPESGEMHRAVRVTEMGERNPESGEMHRAVRVTETGERNPESGEMDKSARVTGITDTIAGEFNKLSLAFVYAGLQSLALMATMTRTIVDKTLERNNARRGDMASKRVVSLPQDMVEAVLDTLEESARMPEKVVDKFYEKYKEEPHA